MSEHDEYDFERMKIRMDRAEAKIDLLNTTLLDLIGKLADHSKRVAETYQPLSKSPG